MLGSLFILRSEERNHMRKSTDKELASGHKVENQPKLFEGRGEELLKVYGEHFLGSRKLPLAHKVFSKKQSCFFPGKRPQNINCNPFLMYDYQSEK